MTQSQAGRTGAKLISTQSVPPDWKNKLPILIAVPLTLIVGTLLAQGQWLWPLLALAIALMAIFGRLADQRLPVIVLCTLLFGYIAGNRGFAQLSISSSLPLFPAEIGLVVTLTILLWQCARMRMTPVGSNELNVLLITWIAFGAIRVAFDLRTHGFMALRDFAMVYYALFFFIARYFAQNSDSAAWFSKTLRISSLVLLPLYILFINFEGFFLSTLTLRGSPLIYLKIDLAGTFMSAGAIAWFLEYEDHPRKKWALAISLALAAAMITTDNRAAMLALAVPMGLLALGGRYRMLRAFAIASVAGALALASWTHLSGRSWQDSPLVGIYERTLSIVDFGGRRTYSTASAEPKSGNNQFRTVWWKTVINETTEANPWLGVGFGHDLADNFLKTYYPDSDEQFTARSPHNFLITTYARMGLVGALMFLAVTFLIFFQAWKAVAHGAHGRELASHCTAIALLMSAFVGVVLEGPMGAVVFWISLGVASSAPPLKPLIPDAAPRLNVT
jgi:O-antigen ligase